jgi:hypothetical protein
MDYPLRICVYAFVAIFCSVFMASQQSLGQELKNRDILVKFKPHLSPAEMEKFGQKHGLDHVKSFSFTGIHHLRLRNLTKMRDALAYFQTQDEVVYAAPNHKRRLLGVVPNDPEWSTQWAMEKIGMPDVWAETQGSSSVIVAIVDTGVEWTHPDLSANMWTNSGETNCSDGIDNDGNGFVDDCRGWDFRTHSNLPVDHYGHGTHVAGIIGAVGNNGMGIAGMNWNVKIMPVKFMDKTDTGEWEGTVADEIAAIEYAANNGAKIINASYGCNPVPDDPSQTDECVFNQAEYDAIKAAGDAGVLFIAAAGNEGVNNDTGRTNYPSSYDLPNLIAVAASDSIDDQPTWSNYGLGTVHLAAPGVLIRSTFKESLYYQTLSGTSMATAFVSGTAALMLAVKPDATPAELKASILASVDKSDYLTGMVSTGGRLNAQKALLTVRNMIRLGTGWNLISLPLQPTNTEVTSVLNSVLKTCNIVWGYSDQSWKYYFSADKSGMLTTMEAGKGYWVKVSQPGTLVISGSQGGSISLSTGWNLVGYNWPSCSTPSSALKSVISQTGIVWEYQGQSWKFFNPADAEGSSLKELCPGSGYWIKMSGEGIWTVP